ncbi:Ger(x)C family spore germination protein [Brevibacillus ruminantium]|uniref:Ger(X)C family spore germination protein n=1 Tax=Brevibacillus ruminantium TaxID=2950604 RepID=A0ABY4WI43_9BACL|nr:Ger(x)C family spore germination protein [Brevibacillus ruminantium]USG66723.1 Ger(x)C family spore germination protein [Brevibacillus ruminantium]
MTRRLSIFALTVWLAILPGCSDRINLEDITLTLMTGIDLNEKNELLFYIVSPVFNKIAKRKVEEFGVRADSVKQARARMDTLVSALTVEGKTQVLALGKRLVEHPDWFILLDTIYRDARVTVNSRIVVVDGPLHDVFHFNPPDKPIIPIHLTKLLDTANRRNYTVRTTASELRSMMADKGITPSVSEFKKLHAGVEVMGTSLLDKHGKYATRLLPKDTVLLQTLTHGKKGETIITIQVPDHLNPNRLIKPKLTFFAKDISRKIKTGYQNGQFEFDVKIKMNISISERLFAFDVTKQRKELEKLVKEELAKRYTKLIHQWQKLQLDPVGFGQYARAYQYKEWKKVEDDWPKAFSQAKVKVTPIIFIKGNGIID